MKKISIILPIYNVDKYLQPCIDSIVEQHGFEQCEMLLIDDGSTDRSSEICDVNAVRNPQIAVYHKTNGGLSDARNYGLKKARGEYVLFFDSDDIMCRDTLLRILVKLDNENIDIFVMDAVTVDEEGRRILKPNFEFKHVGLAAGIVYSGERAIKEQLNGGVLQTTVWLGIYRKAFLIDNQLWFKRGLLHEDELWTPIIFLEAKKVIYEPIDFYAYRIRNNSIMRNEKKDYSKNIASFIYIYSHVTRYYDWKIDDVELLRVLKDDVARRYLYCISVWKMCDYPKLMKKVDRIEILRNSMTVKNRVRALVLLVNSRLYCRSSRQFMR